MTQQQTRNAYNSGDILINLKGRTLVFQLGPWHFTSNPRRTRHYKLDDENWAVFRESSILHKVRLIATKHVKLIKGKK